MEIQAYQLVIIFLYGVLAFALFKFKSVKLKSVVVLLAVIVFAFNPIRHKQEGMASIDRHVKRFDSIPEKVEVENIDFEKKQADQMTSLNQKIEALKNEIHN